MYLDDIFCIGRTYLECQQNVMYTKKLLENLGFIINQDKSCLIPSRQCKFLGFVFDSYEMVLKLPENRITKIKKLLIEFKSRARCQLRDFAKFLGHLTAVQYGWLYTKEFERHKYLCLLGNPSYDQPINLPEHFSSDFNWRINNILVEVNCNPFRFIQFTLEIFSDASSSGWGAYCDSEKVYEFWNEKRNKYAH